MRLLGYALVALVCSWSVAVAAPAPKAAKGGKGGAQAGAKAPANAKPAIDPKVQAELTKLETEYYTAISKQATFLAVKIAEKLLAAQIKATGPDSLEVERRRQTLAGAYQMAGDYANAEKQYTVILKATEKAKGVDSREVLYALMPLMGVYYGMTRYEDAEPTVLRMLTLTKKLDGEKSTAYAQQLSQYATLLNMKNEYSAATRYYEESLKVYESIAKSPSDSTLIGPLQILGGMYWSSNQHPKAIATYNRAIKIAETATDTMLVIRVSTIWSAAMQFSFGGRKDLSGPLFQKAIDITEKEIARLEKDAPDDWSLQSLVGQLGFMYRYNNDLVKAEATYNKAIKLAEKKGQQSGYEGSLADLKRVQGKSKEALALLEKQKESITKMAPSSGNAYDTTIADILRELGDYKRAEKLLVNYGKYAAEKFGKKHPTYAYTMMSLGKVHSESGRIADAEKAYGFALDGAERDLASVLRTGTDQDHAVYFSRHGYILDQAINFNTLYAPKSGTASRLALTTLLRRKGRILDAAAASLATIRSKLSADDKKLLDELNSARAQLSKLTVAGPGATGDQAVFLKEVAALEDKILKLEGQVSKKSAAYRTVNQPIELATIQKLIPKDARLIEIVNYQPYEVKQTYAQMMQMKYKPRRYLAYISSTTGDPVFVDLGEAAPIDTAIESFRKALADPDNDGVTDLGRALYDLTIAKIVPKLGGSTNILIAPDGALNVVPFSALVDDKQEFLVKKYTFTYLTSGRDLLRLSVKTKAQGGGVLFADPKFDATGGAPSPAGPAGKAKTRGARSADIASLQWSQLPGTAAEADAIAKTYKGLKVVRGEYATEGTLKKVKGPKILHLATHGFFLPDEKAPETEDTRGSIGPMGQQMSAGLGGASENPLLRSGLALAGANKLESGDDDGLLTALEASGLDLWGTKLVVLSACETGVGKVTNGDGVYGLRRSLVIAGAESLVMSLWQVDDFATKELMSGFYKRLGDGKPRSGALREVQLQLLANPKYKHPFYWAAFLPAGATTPLKD